ncbi:MAG: hemerythrin domain-containing protein [Caldimonas sp.]
MADDKTKRGSPDSKRLNKSEPYEVAYARKKAKAAGGAKAGAAARPSGAASKARARSGSARAAAAPAARKRAPPKAPVRGAPHPPSAEKTTENTAPRTMKAADAVDLLTDDHLQVSALFKQYEKLAKKKAPARQRGTLAGTICGMLKVHTTIEEEIFYPAARKARIDAALLDEADIEHASAKELIARIQSGDPAGDHYDARVKVLGEYINHHVVEEHTEMFPKCRRGGMDLVALRGRMQARKGELESGAPAMAAEGVPATLAASAESPGILSRISETLFSAKAT